MAHLKHSFGTKMVSYDEVAESDSRFLRGGGNLIQQKKMLAVHSDGSYAIRTKVLAWSR